MDRLVGKYPLPIHASWVRRYALVEHLMGGKIAVISIVASGRSESISLSRAIAARPNVRSGRAAQANGRGVRHAPRRRIID